MGLVLSSVTFILSLIVHVSTFIPPIAVTMRLAAPLHFCAMASFALMIFTAMPLFKARPRLSGEGIFAYWKRSTQKSKALQRRAIELVPKPARVLAGLSFAYAVFNFVVFFTLVEGGSPATKNGEYYLHNHGKKIRDLTKDEYVRMQAYIARGFSGHWFAFSLVPLLYFAYVRQVLLAERANPAAASSS